MRPARAAVITSSLLLAWLLATSILSVLISRVDFLHGIILPGDIPFGELASRIAPARYALALLGAAIGAAAFATACLSLGLAILRGWQKTGADYFATGATAFLLGEILCSVVFLSIIVLGRITPLIVAVALASALVIGLKPLLAFIAARPRGSLANYPRADRLLIGLLAAVMGLALLYSSTRLSYDSVVAYFSTAKLMAVTERPAYTFAYDLFPVSSFHSSILFTAVIQLFGDQAARLLSWVNGLAILLLGLAIAAEVELAPRARLWFLALMLTTTAFVDLLGDGKVDLISTAPFVAAAYWMVRKRAEPSGPVFALVGLLLGFSMIARPFNIALGAVFFVAFHAIGAIRQHRHGEFDLRRFVLAAAWVLPPLLALGAFHLWQNWQWLGDALAPLNGARQLNPITPIIAGTQADARVWWQWQFNPQQLNGYRLLYPLTVSFANSPQSLGTISPLFVGFLPFAVLGTVRARFHRKPVLVWLVLAAAITLVLWVALFSAVMEIRYVLFFWMILFLGVAEIIQGVIEGAASLSRLLVVPLVGALLIFTAVRELNVAFSTYSPVDSTGQAHCYDNEYCEFLQPLNAAAAPGERVFALNSFRYYLRPDLFACASQAQDYARLQSLAQKNSPDFWTELYREGYNYVTFESQYSIFHTHFGPVPSAQGTPTWLHVMNLTSSTDGLQRIYRVWATNAPIPPHTYCEQDASGIWQIRSGSPLGQ